MFDNLTPGQGAAPDSQPTVPPLPNVPQAPASPMAAAPQAPADMFAGLDAGLGSPIPPAGMNSVQSGVAPAGMNPEPAGGSRKYFIVGFLVLLLIGIGVGGYFAYGKFSAMVNKTDEQPAVTETTDETATVKETPTSTATNPAVESADSATTTDTLVATSTIATTSPLGLEAAATATPATSSSVSTADRTKDSDSDGLTDYEETNFYQTNPGLADTDGDTFSDGSEVKNGFNPLGAGKMIDNKIKPQ